MCVTKGYSGDGCVLASTLCKYDICVESSQNSPLVGRN